MSGIEHRPLSWEIASHRRGKVVPEDARRHNRSLVWSTLFREGSMSRADLSRATGLTRVTVSALINDLLDERLVREVGIRDDVRPGKPATLIEVDQVSTCIVVVDLSGSDSMVGATMTLMGEVLQRETRPQSASSGLIVDDVLSLAGTLVNSAPAPIIGVGVGSPGIVDSQGTVLSAPNFGWEGLPLAELLSDHTHAPVIVTNDANAAALGEFTFAGAAEDVLLIRVGLGVGSGVLSGGQILSGAHLAGGELGHVTVGTDGGPQCACGKVGCLEAWLSVSALTARIEAGDEHALRAAGERLGIALAPVMGVLDISEILLSGPAHLLSGQLLEATETTIRARTLTRFHDAVRVRMASQGDDIVLRGAAVPILTTQLGLV